MHPALQRALHGTPDRGATPPRRTRRIRLWDVPTRLFHWLLLLAVSIAIVTAQLGGKWMELHGRAGVGIGALLVFRLVWGVVGNRYARFASFLPTRASLSSYLRGDWQGFELCAAAIVVSRWRAKKYFENEYSRRVGCELCYTRYR